LGPDRYRELSPEVDLPPAFPRAPILQTFAPSAELQQRAQQQQKKQKQKQEIAEGERAKKADVERLQRVQAEAARVEKERQRKKEREERQQQQQLQQEREQQQLQREQQKTQEREQLKREQQEQQQKRRQERSQEELRAIYEKQQQQQQQQEELEKQPNLAPLPAAAWTLDGRGTSENFGAPSVQGLVGPGKFPAAVPDGNRAAPWVGWESPPPAAVKEEERGVAAGGERKPKGQQQARQQIVGALGLGGGRSEQKKAVARGVQQQVGGDASVSSVLLLDGTSANTAAMVRCMRKGHGALECPVCLQLFNLPVTPVGSECKCTFCEGCFNNLVQFGGRCVKCKRGLPSDAQHVQRNTEIERAVEEYKSQGGEEAELASLLTGLKSKPKAARYRMLDVTELRLDPKPLASGAYGQVFKGSWVKNNIAVAVKKVLRTSVMTREQTMDSFRKEVEILAMLDHPHVLKLYGAVLDDDNICIVTELVPGGSLFDLIHTKPLLKPEAVIAISTGVCKGMTYLHSMGIIHRDLKPGNLLMGAVASPSGPQLVVKVADFGLARVQDTGRTMTGGIGTSQYTAPEVLRSERYDTRADVFSFGVILWEIHARKIPYSEMNQMQIAVAVATQDHRPPPPKHCPAPFWHLMQQCWHSRPTGMCTLPENHRLVSCPIRLWAGRSLSLKASTHLIELICFN